MPVEAPSPSGASAAADDAVDAPVYHTMQNADFYNYEDSAQHHTASHVSSSRSTDDFVYFDPASVSMEADCGDGLGAIQFKFTPLVQGLQVVHYVTSQEIEAIKADQNASQNATPKPKKLKNRRRSSANGDQKHLSRAKLNKFSDEVLQLSCEWDDCTEVFNDMKAFMEHVTVHVEAVAIRRLDDAENVDTANTQGCVFSCLWRSCGFETGSSGDMVRHVHFHTFHTRLKCHGTNILRETGVTPCTMADENQHNIVPELTEPFRCLWAGCAEAEREDEFPEAQRFYWHVHRHSDEVRGTRADAFACRWADCHMSVATPAKLKDHLKSHSQERSVACPVCGGLFANRSKFYDHCQRQKPFSELHHKCSYCGKSFALERLLRDHMRSHVNHYKCPMCDMTCPTPTALNAHMAYRHSEDRQFECDACDTRCKSASDLAAHVRKVHADRSDDPDDKKRCPVENCDYEGSSLAAVKAHVRKEHKKEGPNYCCHLCPMRFRRGNYLTKHLQTKHDFKWPSGHSRFRYRCDESGLFHLQTDRLESADLTHMMDADSTVDADDDNEEEEEDEDLGEA